MARAIPSFLASACSMQSRQMAARMATFALLVLVLCGWSPQVGRTVPVADDAGSAAPKIDMSPDRAAGKEIEVARYYLGKRDYTGAINRCKIVVTRYRASEGLD